jgi:hypothetical protein
MNLKTNEEITLAFETEENEKFELLKKNIINYMRKLRELQREYKVLTGKNYHVF